MSDNNYGSEKIQVLTGLEPVRKRPGMYIGSTDARGLHHLVYEIVDNAVDEALAGYCTTIIITIHADGSLTVEDNGRGIPVDIHKELKVSALQVVLTVLHAGGKFDESTYKVAGGLHGVGASVVNALSSHLKAEVHRDGKVYAQEYSKGVPLGDVKEVGTTNKTGTIITFTPDTTIFETGNFHYKTLATRFREMAFLNKGLSISIIDERDNKKEEFCYQGGLKEFVEYLNSSRGITKLHEPFYFDKEKDGIRVECTIQYNDSYQELVHSFANNINTHEGGTHLTGFRSALTRCLNTYAEKHGMLQKEEKLTAEDFREGLCAIVSVKISQPQFEGQTKTKLGNSEAKTVVESLTSQELAIYLEETPTAAKTILKKAIDAAKARAAARKAKDLVRRKSVFENTTLPGKLTDCSTKNREESELFLVEGDSAGGTAKQGRNKETQAILPLRGKPLNVEKARLLKALQNNEITAMITALGTGIGDEFDISKLRYNKIIIMTDADVDGHHIACLLLTFFYRFMKELVEQGHIYLAQPPLYKVQKGKKFEYAFTDEEKEKLVAEYGGYEGVGIQRYKGLGEMNDDQLWDTTMNPETRILKKITIEDAVTADEMFSILMGDQVEPRKNFILEHAKEAELDV